MRRRKQFRKQKTQYLLAGGSMLALMGLWINPPTHRQAEPEPDACQEVVESRAVLSRDQLSQLLMVPERAPKEEVKAVVSDPYCVLRSLEVRPGISAHREAYPLAFDPDTWLVLLYEDGEYAGYDFNFHR